MQRGVQSQCDMRCHAGSHCVQRCNAQTCNLKCGGEECNQNCSGGEQGCLMLCIGTLEHKLVALTHVK